MLSLVIKYGFIVLCSIYATISFMNKRRTTPLSYYATRAIFAIFQVALVTWMQQHTMFVSILIMILSSTFIDAVLLKLSIRTAFLATVISYGTSYLFNVAGALVLGVVKMVINDHTSSVTPTTFAIIGAIQTFFTVSLLHLKRLRHGLPFLRNSYYSNLGVYLSLFLMILVAVFGIKAETHRVTMILFFLTISLGVLLLYWCKNYLSQEYLDQIHKKEREDLEKALDAARKKNRQLRMENETFSKIIHKDNKLIPAMELAVSQLLYSIAQDDTQQGRKEQAQNILKQLKALSAERAGIIKTYEESNSKFPTLGLSSLDALFHFMVQKASTAGILFDLTLDDGIDQVMTENISESDASTLLADLIENALIAPHHGQHKKAVQVKLGVDTGIFYISVSDSGAPFPPEVLERWGIERITTHADTGGSGIGMMTIYELCQKYSASFEIEQVQNVSPYRKCVSIRFDGQSAFRVH